MNHKIRQRKIKDGILNILTYLSSGVGVVILVAIFVFIFGNGFKYLSWDLITKDYYKTTYNLKTENNIYYTNHYENVDNLENFSVRWGIALEDSKDTLGRKIVVISYMKEDSPFNSLISVETNKRQPIKTGFMVTKIIASNESNDYIACLPIKGAADMVYNLDQGTCIQDMILETGGGGIRSSLLTTIYLIGLTILISLPIGIGSAIYLVEFAKKNKVTQFIHSLIDITTGIPSIIFGLVGALIFIPFTNTVFKSHGGSIISGALTMSIILLPTIIKTSEEALNVVPKTYEQASLALGANKAQTIWKVVLPNALGGLLTATLLSIGRIIGESAALIYAIGSTINDNVALTNASTTLAVHIWALMSGDIPNIPASCAISIIILIVVLILNLLVKILSNRLKRRFK